MGKAKKGKKGTKDDESDDEIDLETKVGADENVAGSGKKKITAKVQDEKVLDDDENEASTKKKKGKKDRKPVIEVSDADSAADDIHEKSSENVKSKKQTKKADKSKVAESSDEEEGKPAKPSKNKKAPKVELESDDEIHPSKLSKGNKKGFALLMDDEDSHSEPDVASDSGDNKQTKKKVVKSDSVEKEVNGEEKTAGKKGKKPKKKKPDEDEEDIEQMLAELALEYSGGKKDEVKEESKVETVKKVKTKGKDSIIKDSIEPEAIETEVVIEEAESTVKSAAQKKKEKKEREKLKKQAQKKPEPVKKADSMTEGTPERTLGVIAAKKDAAPQVTAVEPAAEAEAEVVDDKKKKKKKTAKELEEEKKEKAKGPNKKMIAAMQEALKKAKEEEERFARDEEERIRRLEEADRAREEAARLDQERREKKKLKDKERKERLKNEGKLLTTKQKVDRARAQAMLDALKAQGLDMPNVGEKKAPRPGTRVRGKSKPLAADQTTAATVTHEDDKPEDTEQKIELEIVEKEEEKEEEVSGDVKDAWDAESSEEEEVEEEEEEEEEEETPVKKKKEESEESESEDEDSSEEEDHRTDAERKREKALARIKQRREDAEAGKTLDQLRAAVVCVLGHVDTGKTKILDKLRRTNVQDGEAGGITQQIGATNVPIDNIREQTKVVRGFSDYEMKIPGLLIIDTPGHESFSNLRSRGSSLCDIAILVVDIMHGIEPQTLESINLLKLKKTPFVVALNKIDRLYDWQTMARKDVRDVLKAQAPNTQLEFEQRVKEVVVQFAEQGLNASLFYENPDIRSYVSLVPTSAITGEGICNLLALIVEYCQNMLAKRLMYSDELQATVLEVKAIPGLGTTIDAILINGKLREGDTMIVAGTDGPIVTQIRSLLMPQPMKELRVKNAYIEYKEIKAAQGVKIAAKDLEKAIAGLNMQVAQKPDEVDILREEVAKELRHALSNIKLQDRGVYVQASTLGSLEALLEFLKTSKIPYANIRIGPVVKKDVMKASTMLEHDSQYATILAFDVKIEKDAQELADTLGVKIFQADIIYHLFDKFMAYRDELKQRKREEFKHVAVFPCKLKILPQFVFNSRDPIVMGVMVEAGIVREGTPICVPSREFVEIGVVRSIESNKKNVETARKGQEVCVKIDAIPGEAPKMFGRHFDESDFLVSKISRASIDACKDYFRDDLLKADWELMVELKKQFEIL